MKSEEALSHLWILCKQLDFQTVLVLLVIMLLMHAQILLILKFIQ